MEKKFIAEKNKFNCIVKATDNGLAWFVRLILGERRSKIAPWWSFLICTKNIKAMSLKHISLCFCGLFSSRFVMNSKLSFSRLFHKIVGEKYIIFPERGSKNHIIFPESQWNKKRDIETNVSITIRAGIKQSPKQKDVGLVLYYD